MPRRLPDRTRSPGPYQLDARRCISYWTIEHEGLIPTKQAEQLDGWVFGCDICQDVCPWNRKAPSGRMDEFQPRPEWVGPDLIDWLNDDPTTWPDRLKGTALKRTEARGPAEECRAGPGEPASIGGRRTAGLEAGRHRGGAGRPSLCGLGTGPDRRRSGDGGPPATHGRPRSGRSRVVGKAHARCVAARGGAGRIARNARRAPPSGGMRSDRPGSRMIRRRSSLRSRAGRRVGHRRDLAGDRLSEAIHGRDGERVRARHERDIDAIVALEHRRWPWWSARYCCRWRT